MKSLLLAVSLIAVATSAEARMRNWTSNDYGSQTTYFNGDDGSTGTANNYGSPTTYYHFNNADGTQDNCTANNYGGQTTYYNCY